MPVSNTLALPSKRRNAGEHSGHAGPASCRASARSRPGCSRMWRSKLIKRKSPVPSGTGPWSNSDDQILLLLLSGRFLLRRLLRCFLHRNILPNIKVCDAERHDVASMYKVARRKSQEKNEVTGRGAAGPGRAVTARNSGSLKCFHRATPASRGFGAHAAPATFLARRGCRR
jgi:hypothetical protein